MRTTSRRGSHDRGETLIEVVMTVLITAITVTALVSGLATAGAAGQTQRASVSADGVMRNYAESLKTASRACVVGKKMRISYRPPPGFTVATAPRVRICPDVGNSIRLTLDVTGPSGLVESMQIVVRTP